MSHHLKGFPIVISIPVQWGEMDAYGHVNNAVFFRYFESARMAYLDRCGFVESYTRDKVGAILHSTQCRYWRPVFHPDTVLIGARTDEVLADRLRMSYRVVSTAQNEIAAEGSGLIVSFDYQAHKKTPLPESVRTAIAEMESEG